MLMQPFQFPKLGTRGEARKNCCPSDSGHESLRVLRCCEQKEDVEVRQSHDRSSSIVVSAAISAAVISV